MHPSLRISKLVGERRPYQHRLTAVPALRLTISHEIHAPATEEVRAARRAIRYSRSLVAADLPHVHLPGSFAETLGTTSTTWRTTRQHWCSPPLAFRHANTREAIRDPTHTRVGDDLTTSLHTTYGPAVHHHRASQVPMSRR